MSASKILIINGHPDQESFNFALSKAYISGAKSNNAEVQVINIRELDFNPNLQYGYRKRTELEPDLLDAQEKIKWADHLVWIYPVWWGSLPAIMKGFIDRTFLPGFAFAKREGSVGQVSDRKNSKVNLHFRSTLMVLSVGLCTTES